ncbi:hypothetical protein [Sporomusa acidovorans]|uniref:hypothetical protein n=1 Tax=Sporomusa acidovorans TaxID=112900 RepID=UPI001160A19F|nr:hypothetical protein [Sporomusa acidovorans]
MGKKIIDRRLAVCYTLHKQILRLSMTRKSTYVRGPQRANDSGSLALLSIANGPGRCSPIRSSRGRRCRDSSAVTRKQVSDLYPVPSKPGLIC